MTIFGPKAFGFLGVLKNGAFYEGSISEESNWLPEGADWPVRRLQIRGPGPGRVKSGPRGQIWDLTRLLGHSWLAAFRGCCFLAALPKWLK